MFLSREHKNKEIDPILLPDISLVVTELSLYELFHSHNAFYLPSYFFHSLPPTYCLPLSRGISKTKSKDENWVDAYG